MSINIEKYLHSTNMWPALEQYILDHPDTYNLTLSKSESTSESICKYIKKMAKKNLDSNTEYDTFRKGLDNLYKQKSSTLGRENLYRLCFAIGLPSDCEAQDLFINYMHEAELSPRSLDEFIIICGLRLHLNWNTVSTLRNKYKQHLLDEPIAPVKLVEGSTQECYDTVINATIQNESDLNNWLSDDKNLAFFAKTRNTHYFALFIDIDWSSFASKSPLSTVPNADTTIKLYIRLDLVWEKSLITMKNYYHQLFGLHSCEDEAYNIDPNTFLTTEEITSLSKIFKHAFMTYETFCTLVQRTRPTDISSGTYMLRMLEEMDPNVTNDYDDFVDFTDAKIFIDSCNSYLRNAGFPALNPYNTFDALIIDIYHETLEENPGVSSPTIKYHFFTKLRKYLKDIASLT